VSSNESAEMQTQGFWSAGRVFACVLTLLWACLLLSGIDGLIAFHAREPGLPLVDHLGLYLVLPTVGLIASSASLIWAKNLPRWLSNLGLLVEALLLFFALVFWTGGV
jgi:hypothetical protein